MQIAAIEATMVKLRFRKMPERVEQLVNQGFSNKKILKLITSEQPKIVKLRLAFEWPFKHWRVTMLILATGLIAYSWHWIRQNPNFLGSFDSQQTNPEPIQPE